LAHTIFAHHLEAVLLSLALDIVRDGEGATKLVEVTVTGAATNDDATKAAKAIALSPLVKTAIHGEDANWGRIAAAVGYSGIDFTPEDMEISINGVTILKKNFTVTLPNSEANKTLKGKTVNLTVALNGGAGKSTCWTCDFSEQYVVINGSYRS
jgi:glutamate N-acetyltransferase/amino-acid N-acetyltransferase